MIAAIDKLDLQGKRVFIRVDFNVPLKDGKIVDDARIQATLPTIRYVLKQKGRVILASHLGRPKGEKNPKYSLAPIAKYLTKVFPNQEVIFPEDCIGDGVKKLVSELKEDQILLLENLRFHKEEEKNDENFSQKLASLCNVYINDAFGTSHRAHASTEGITRFVAEKGIGFLMQKELEFLGKVSKNPERPFVAILGGAKVSDKIGVIDNLLSKVDKLLIGGAMSYTFLKAKGCSLGNSLVENEKVHTAKKTLKRAETKGVPILLPMDHIISKENREGSKIEITSNTNVPEGWMALDIGPKTLTLFEKELQVAKTIFWNGPLGVYEIKDFAKGTLAVAKILSESQATTIIGGGDSAAAVKECGLDSKITHISTGGGASLEFVEGKILPGVAALEIK